MSIKGKSLKVNTHYLHGTLGGQHGSLISRNNRVYVLRLRSKDIRFNNASYKGLNSPNRQHRRSPYSPSLSCRPIEPPGDTECHRSQRSKWLQFGTTRSSEILRAHVLTRSGDCEERDPTMENSQAQATWIRSPHQGSIRLGRANRAIQSVS